MNVVNCSSIVACEICVVSCVASYNRWARMEEYLLKLTPPVLPSPSPVSANCRSSLLQAFSSSVHKRLKMPRDGESWYANLLGSIFV